jgi:DNA-binding response OmpR family regulator
VSEDGRTVLIADDDPRMRSLLRWTLEQWQFNVDAA